MGRFFHVSQLKKAVKNHPVEAELPPGLEIDDVVPTKPEAILATGEANNQGETVLNG